MVRLVLKELCRYEIGTFADIIYRNALLHADDEAFIYGAERITFSQFNARVNGLIKSLHTMGVKKGDVLGLAAWNCIEYMDVVGAAMKGGFIVSPYNPKLSKNELGDLINYSEATALFVGPELLDIVSQLRAEKMLPGVKHYISIEGPAPDFVCNQELVAEEAGEPDEQIREDDPYIIFFTSGTTGLPKGAVYTHRRRMENYRLKCLEMAIEQGSRHLIIIPLFHTGGDSHAWIMFYVGGCNVILEERSFNPRITMQAIQDYRLTDVHLVPTQLVAMVNQPDVDKYDLSTLKRMFYAGSSMPSEVLRKALEIFGPVFAQGYGLTESGPMTCGMYPRDHMVLDKSEEEQKVLKSVGQPCIGVHVRIVDEENKDVRPGEPGEIIIKHKSIMQEYWKRPSETSEAIVDGWLKTGDIGSYDLRGFVYIVDRKKDLIITGGENVFPREIEEVLYRHPAVAEAAVIGIPDPVWVEKVHAVIALKEGAAITEDEIINFCKENLARYKAPKSVEFVEALPKNPQGKILKRELREPYRKD
jgi:long-chain acyl-CoA synthetase